MGFMDIIPATAPKRLTIETNFYVFFQTLMHTQKSQNFMVWK